MPLLYDIKKPISACYHSTTTVSHILGCITSGKWHTQEYFLGGRGSTNLVEDRGQTERGSGDSSPLVRDSVQFANE
jgi:hypothetical protein